jgi:putative ABC transport system permease protein
MGALQTLRVALRALLRNKLRSALTALGIIIGVGAVIAMVDFGEGAKAQVEASFAAMGSSAIIVMPGSTSAGGARGGFGSQPTLTWDDLKAIQNEVPSVKYAAPVLRTSSQVMSEDQNWTTQIQGTSPDFFLIRSWFVSSGVTLTQSDVDSGVKVAVLGQTVVDKLFGENADPLGQLVRIKNIPFQVVGVLSKKGQSPMGQDYDDVVYVPVTTFGAKIQGGLHNYLSGAIYIGANTPDETPKAEKQITALLRDRHHLADGTDDDFFIRNLTELANAQKEGAKTMTTLLASIAFVSLLVGGIGIMNIMLVSVTERTREIGLRMAVGAKPRNVLLQFVVEALTLSTMGGIIGVVIAVGGGQIASKYGIPMLVRPDIIVIAVGFSAAVGIIFGLYPAWKASKLDPIDALRYE